MMRSTGPLSSARCAPTISPAISVVPTMAATRKVARRAAMATGRILSPGRCFGLRATVPPRKTGKHTDFMRIAILGSGAVGGYYGARLAREGHDVTFIARGAHLAALREKGLEVRSPVLGDFVARARAEEDTSQVGVVDLVMVAVKTY